MLTALLAWVHDLDQWALRFTDSVGVRWYGLAYIAGFFFGWWILRALARRGRILLNPTEATDLVFCAALGVLVGGRVGYAAFYEPDMLWSLTADRSFPFWRLLALNQGGMASHGGMIGVIVAAWWFARTRRKPLLHALDLLVLVAPIGLFFGRVANFINGELLGVIIARAGQPAPWWAVKYPQELLSAGYIRVMEPELQEPLNAVLQPYYNENFDWDPAVRAMIADLQSGPPETRRALAAALDPLLTSRAPSQLVQAGAEGLLLFAALWCIWARPRKPGVVGCWFLILYGLMRIGTEFVRLPDDHLAVQRLAGLTRGQWLSLLMVASGLAALGLITRRSKSAPIGGWRARTSPAPAPPPDESGPTL